MEAEDLRTGNMFGSSAKHTKLLEKKEFQKTNIYIKVTENLMETLNSRTHAKHQSEGKEYNRSVNYEQPYFFCSIRCR